MMAWEGRVKDGKEKEVEAKVEVNIFRVASVHVAEDH